MVAKAGVTTKIDKLAVVAGAVAELARTRVMVGIPQEDDPRDQGGSIGNAALGYIHEIGAPEANIPARPWLKPGIAGANIRITQLLATAGGLALEGKLEAANRALGAAGTVARDAAKAKLATNVPPPLAPATLAARRRRGVTRENTLIDTAQMQGAVTYVIRRV